MSAASGTLAVYGKSVKPLPNSEESGYVFSGFDPDTVASDVTIAAGTETLQLPEKISRRIADPSSMRPMGHTISAGSGDVVIRGGDGGGAMTLTLSFRSGSLIRAEADTVASDTPWVVWP